MEKNKYKLETKLLEKLLKEANEGDEFARKALYDNYHPIVEHFLHNYVRPIMLISKKELSEKLEDFYVYYLKLAIKKQKDPYVILSSNMSNQYNALLRNLNRNFLHNKYYIEGKRILKQFEQQYDINVKENDFSRLMMESLTKYFNEENDKICSIEEYLIPILKMAYNEKYDKGTK